MPPVPPLAEAAEMTDKTTATYPVLPLRDIVVFPHMIVPLFVGRERSVRALEQVMKDDRQILLASQKDAAKDDPAEDDIYRVGALANVLQLLKLPDGTVKVLVEGRTRAKILNFVENDSYFEAVAVEIADGESDAATVEALTRSLTERFERYVKLNKNVPEEALANIGEIDDAPKLADTIAGHLGVKLSERQKLLEEPGVAERLEMLLKLVQGEISVLRPAGREEDQEPGQEPDGADPARLLPQRTDEGDPARARRER
jgi:ATP-dependent Lon protease